MNNYLEIPLTKNCLNAFYHIIFMRQAQATLCGLEHARQLHANRLHPKETKIFHSYIFDKNLLINYN